MQQDAVEVSFCELCGTSIPAGDLASGAAVRHHGKAIGACCVAAVRGESGVAAPRTGEGRLVPIAVVVLAAIAAATIFLDQKIAAIDTSLRTSHELIADAQRSDSDVLQRIGVAMDGASRRGDVDAMAAKLGEAAANDAKSRDEMRLAVEAMKQDLAALRQDVRGQAGSAVDYRPLFEETRQRQQRMLDLLAGLRTAPLEAPAAPPVVVTPAAPAPGDSGIPTLPGPLAEQAKKLKAADPAVRFEAVDELFRAKDPAVVPFVLPLAADADAFVRRLTMDGLRDFKRADVVETLLVGLGDGDLDVRDTAWASLKVVTGQKLPFDATANKDSRSRAAQRWQEWWEKSKGTFGS